MSMPNLRGWEYPRTPPVEPIAYNLPGGRVLCAPGCMSHQEAQDLADAGREAGEVHPWTVDLWPGDPDLVCSGCGRPLVKAPACTPDDDEDDEAEA
ncbi:hypothetical protein F5972_08530 [Microbispora cellulosiformans]|uniref:Uncharacterized protein n=1 Tax=Microbispora cellulosiformans TaxID=2614688 RepID=A0A5J5K7B6_9ACTN|nr:hypothetical protein [Microbispora cellulosiformans]KAA9379688.1 hypothetical protein F5972_08530 [Microbispora cellulosiformans]